MMAFVQYAVSEERAVVWAKALLREVRPELVVVAASIPSMHCRAKGYSPTPKDGGWIFMKKIKRIRNKGSARENMPIKFVYLV